MRFLANENFPEDAIAALDAAGHDVASVRLGAPGANDEDVLAWAEQRVLLTFDKDFGELARASGLPPTCGIVPFRVPMPKPTEVGNRLARLLTSRADWAGKFSVVEPGRIRMRPLA
jgi:predicted nuclease of predicted toxin-antitoxin system